MKRVFHESDSKQLLEAIRDCREACIRGSTAAPIGGDVYKACQDLTDAIDRMAEVLTGDGSYFYAKWDKAGR